MSTLTILGWICTGIGALSLAAIIVVVALAAAYDWQQKRADKRAPADVGTYEASPYGPVRRFRNDLCMVATCNGVKSVDLGAGWIVCTDHARTLISGNDAA